MRAAPHPKYSAGVVPFAWMMKEKEDGIPLKAKEHGITFRPDLEPTLSFDSTWVQDKRNQLAMLDSFFGAIAPQESLVFFYAKRTPLTDDPRRVIVGIGRVNSVDPYVEYEYEKNSPAEALRCVLWERNVHHSIREKVGDGFLLPYHELIALAAADPSIDLPSLVLHAPEGAWEAFSMGSEHVSHDQAITALLECAAVLDRIARVLPGPWTEARTWVDGELNRLWKLRGAFPGLGSALTALGLANGTLVAHEVGRLLYEDGGEEIRDPWPLVDKVFHNPMLLPPDLAVTVGKHYAKLWDGLRPERKALLQLLARFAITADQASRWFRPEVRQKAGIAVTDAEILSNPYLFFEADRGRLDSIAVATIDRGIFPDEAVRTAVPMPEPSACGETIDPRRVRALCIDALDRAAADGHTLLPQAWLIERVCAMSVVPACPLSADWIDGFAADLEPALTTVPLANGSPGWQLDKFAGTKKIILSTVTRRVAGKGHTGTHDWRAAIDQKIGQPVSAARDPETEEAARQEKAMALETIYRSRFSVLVGPAGTGKTVMLQTLLTLPGVEDGGVLLLAPTGKARVQMQRNTEKAQARTLAQFLLGLERYDADTGRYLMDAAAGRERGFKTVIIDESSMLTEEQLAATLDALEPTVVERLILVGDPRQLPPIGAGRPFVDIVRHLRASAAGSYAELKLVRRQTEEATGDLGAAAPRDDVLLSRWFGGDAPEPGDDEVWDRLAAGKARGIEAIQWDSEASLQS